MALLDAVARGVVPRGDISAAVARQIGALDDPRVRERLGEVWGTLRDTSAEKADLVARYTALLTPEEAKRATDILYARLRAIEATQIQRQIDELRDAVERQTELKARVEEALKP